MSTTQTPGSITTSPDRDGDSLHIQRDPRNPDFVAIGAGKPEFGDHHAALVEVADLPTIFAWLWGFDPKSILVVPEADDLDGQPEFAALVDTFQQAWEAADAAGQAGQRTVAGLKAVFDAMRVLRDRDETPEV